MESIDNSLQTEIKENMSETRCVDMNSKESIQVLFERISQAHLPESTENNELRLERKSELMEEEKEEEENEHKLLWMCNEVYCNEDMYDTLANEAERLISHCGRLLKMPEETEKSLRNWIRSDANLFRSNNNNHKSNTSSYLSEDKSTTDIGKSPVTHENSYVSESQEENNNEKKEMVCIPSLNLVLAAVDRLNTHSIRTKRAMAVSASASLPLRGSIFTQHNNSDVNKTNIHDNSLATHETKEGLSKHESETDKELVKLQEVVLCARLIAWYCLSTARFCGFAFNHMSREASGRPTPVITRHSRARLRREFPGHYSTAVSSSHSSSASSSLKSSFAQSHMNEHAKKKTEDKDSKHNKEEQEEEEHDNVQEMDEWVGSRMSSAAASSLAQSILSTNLTDEQLAEQFYRPAINAAIKYSTFTYHDDNTNNNGVIKIQKKEEEGKREAEHKTDSSMYISTENQNTYIDFINCTVRSSVLWLLTALFIRFPDTKFNTAAYLPMLFPTGTSIESLISNMNNNNSNNTFASPMPHPLLAPLLYESSFVVRSAAALAILSLLRKLHSVLLYAEEAKMHQRAFAAISTQCGEMLFTLHDALYKSLLRFSSEVNEVNNKDYLITSSTASMQNELNDTNKSTNTKCVEKSKEENKRCNNNKVITGWNVHRSHFEKNDDDDEEVEDDVSFTEWLVEMNQKRKEKQTQSNATSEHWEEEQKTHNANKSSKDAKGNEGTDNEANPKDEVSTNKESTNNEVKNEMFKSLSRTVNGLILEVFAAVVRSTPYRRCTRCTHVILHTLQLPLLRFYLRHIHLPEHLCVTRLLMQVFNNESLNQAVLSTLFASSDWTNSTITTNNNNSNCNRRNNNNFRVSYTQDGQWSFRQTLQPSSTYSFTSCESSEPPPPPYSPDTEVNLNNNMISNKKQSKNDNPNGMAVHVYSDKQQQQQQRAYSFLIDELLANAVYGSELWRCVVQLARLYPPVIHTNFNVLIQASQELFDVLHEYEQLISSSESSESITITSHKDVNNANKSNNISKSNNVASKNKNAQKESSNNTNNKRKNKGKNKKGNKNKEMSMEQTHTTKSGKEDNNKQSKSQSVNDAKCGNKTKNSVSKNVEEDRKEKIRRSRHSYNTCVIAFAECLRAWLHFMGYVWKGFDNNSLDPAFRPRREKQRASLEEKRIIYTHIIGPALSLEQPSEVIQIVLLRCLAQVGEKYIAELPHATLHEFVRYVRDSCVCSNAEIRAEALTTIGVWLWQYSILDEYAPSFIHCAMHIVEEDEDHVVRAKAAFALSNVCSRLPRSNVASQEQQYELKESEEKFVNPNKDCSVVSGSKTDNCNSFYELIVKANLLHSLAESALFATMKDKEDDLLVSCHGVRMMNYLLTVLTVEELQLPVSFCNGSVGENFMKVLITFVEDGRPFSIHRFNRILNKCNNEFNYSDKEYKNNNNSKNNESKDDIMPFKKEMIDEAQSEQDLTDLLKSVHSDVSLANTNNSNNSKAVKAVLYASRSNTTSTTTAAIGDPKRRWNAAHALGTGLGHGTIFLAEPILCNEAIHCLMRIVVKDNIYKVRIQAALALSQIPYFVGDNFFERNHGNTSSNNDNTKVTTNNTFSSTQIRFSWGSVASEVAEALCVALQNATTSENFLQYREIEPLKQSLRNALEVMIITATPSAELERVFTTHRNLLRKEGLL